MLPTKFQFISEEKIKMWKVNGHQVMAKAHIAFGKVIYKP